MNNHEADEQRWSELLTSAQEGDRQAYELLLREVAPVVRAYLISRFGPFSLIDDCVQECLLAIHAGRHSYDARRPFRPWLFAIVRNRTIDVLRHHRTDKTVDGPGYTTPDPTVEIDGARLLAKLPKIMREAVILTKFMGMSTRECADRLAVSENVVKVRVHRGLRKLRATWDENR